jgi:DinB superfamily
MIKKPSHEDYPEYYKIYIDSLLDFNILDDYEKQTNEILDLYKNFSEEKLMYKYAQDKWSIKEVLGHLLDSEIIMGYRALTYARKDKTNLPMYDHDEYVKTGSFDLVDSDLLIKHYAAVRESNLLLFRSIKGDVWSEKGITGSKNFTTSTIPYIVTGHTQHHLNVLKEKYLC